MYISGEQTVIRDGEIGVAPGTSVTGNYRQDSGSTHRNDACKFLNFSML
jgi:hypothetical protein